MQSYCPSKLIISGINTVLLLCFYSLFAIVSADDHAPPAFDRILIRIGVLSHRGDEVTHHMWDPTASYLSKTLAPYEFKVIPLDFDEIDSAVEEQKIEFLLVNSGIYVNMEVRHRISRIATLNNGKGAVPLNVFGGVIFTKRDRTDINDITDLKDKTMMAVDEISLGGFQMAYGIMQANVIDPYNDLASLEFGGTHDAVVFAVKEGRVEVGTIRSGILEKMAAQGKVRLDDFRIINPVIDDGFPFNHSTTLYPEWPFSKLKNTPNDLAQKVAVALLNMNSSHMTHFNDYAGWTVPLDYQPVHDLFKRLNLPPYELSGEFTLADAIKRYWLAILFVLIFLIMLTIMSTWVSRLNTQLKKSKRSLEYQHDLILNSVCDGIYGVDSNGNCTFINRSMQQLSGWTLVDLQQGNQHYLLHHTHEDGTPHELQDCPVYLTFQDNESRFIDNDVFWRKNGTSFPVEYSCTPMKDHKGDTVGSVVVFRDISERKKAEEASARHRKELAHMARLNTMGEMASGIAHELNQPLTAIATNSYACIQMMENTHFDKNKVIDVLETIGAQAKHSGEVIQQLRQFVRKEEPKRININLNNLIKEVLNFIKSEALKSSVRIQLQLSKNLPDVMVQPIQIEQVILNLLKNSIDAMQTISKGKRNLSIYTDIAGDNAVVVTVEDSGTGIDKEIQDGLFDPFVTTKEDGMGLGLSISKGIIEAHQGRLYVHSASKRGTIIRFTLPNVNAKDINGKQHDN